MFQASREYPFMAAGQIRDVIDLDLSVELIRQRLREAGLKNQDVAQEPLLFADSKAKRLAFEKGLRSFNHRRLEECFFYKQKHSPHAAES